MGQVNNPASEEYWAEVKKEFEDLDDNSLAVLNIRAENSRRAAAWANAQAALQRRQQAQAAAARVADAPVPPVRFAQRAPCTECPRSDCLCDRPMSINIFVEQFDSGRTLLEVEQLDKDESHNRGRDPAVAAASLDKYHKEKKKGIALLAQEFEAKTSQGPRAPRHGDFPKKVRYARCCGAMCLQQTPWPILSMYIALINGFTACAKRFRSCADLLAADVVLAIEV